MIVIPCKSMDTASLLLMAHTATACECFTCHTDLINDTPVSMRQSATGVIIAKTMVPPAETHVIHCSTI